MCVCCFFVYPFGMACAEPKNSTCVVKYTAQWEAFLRESEEMDAVSRQKAYDALKVAYSALSSQDLLLCESPQLFAGTDDVSCLAAYRRCVVELSNKEQLYQQTLKTTAGFKSGAKYFIEYSNQQLEKALNNMPLSVELQRN